MLFNKMFLGFLLKKGGFLAETTYKVAYEVNDESDSGLGMLKTVTINYHKNDELDITYTIGALLGKDDVVVRLDFKNLTGRKLTINKTTPINAGLVSLGNDVDAWSIIGDAKSYREPYMLEKVAEMDKFNSWWYIAVRDQESKNSILMGSLQNNKGLGCFHAEPASGKAIKLEAKSDYEKIEMPQEASITGEYFLIHFGKTGIDGLHRFGELIADVHDINLRKDHPINISQYNSYLAWGSAVINNFEYKKYNTQLKNASFDQEWVRKNFQASKDLGLQDYGYSVNDPDIKAAYAGRPLGRRYGTDDGTIKQAHPQWYKEGWIDFSNPEVIAYEKNRVDEAFKGKEQKIVTYNWDFTDRWKKLEGQYDPFQTSAETYRTALGIWREKAKSNPGGALSTMMMNIPGLNYDMADRVRVGQDSDSGYYLAADDWNIPQGQLWQAECTFITGLVRQASGRFFYNGKVWWTNPDSYHVYAGGLYIHQQGKVHASFNSIAGNVCWLAEPFIEYDSKIPEDRLEIIKRVAPTTSDVSEAVDVFEHNPARLWNMPISRPFGKWNVAALFKYNYDRSGTDITQTIAFEELGLSPQKKYLVYEFWNKEFLGVKQGGFTRTLKAPDCEVYSIVEKTDHPQLISTSRHVRNMAYDITELD